VTCHSDSTLAVERNGKTISLFTDISELANSPHDALQCVDCHSGFDADTVPHKEIMSLVNCLSCHKDIVNDRRFHTRRFKASASARELLASCKKCHGTHNTR